MVIVKGVDDMVVMGKNFKKTLRGLMGGKGKVNWGKKPTITQV